jgi:Tfp pilus assembly protein PilF
VAGLTALADAAARRRPYLTVGWLWFLGMLVPVSGVVQAGLQSMADRYMYLPSIGLLVAVVWASADAVRRVPALRLPAIAATGAALTALGVCTWFQEGYWATTYDLFDHALAVDPDNWQAHEIIAMLMAAAGDDAGAARHYQRSVELSPDNPDVRYNYGLTLDRLGRIDEAIDQYRRAVRTTPFLAVMRYRLAMDLARRKDYAGADGQFAEATRLAPTDASIQTAWGISLLASGRRADAVDRFQAALRLNPTDDTARAGLARAENAAPADGVNGTIRPMTGPG